MEYVMAIFWMILELVMVIVGSTIIALNLFGVIDDPTTSLVMVIFIMLVAKRSLEQIEERLNKGA